LRNTRVVAPDEEGVDRPTVAGLLAFGAAPQEHLPSAYIEAAIYRGVHLTSDELVHQQRIGGRVGDQIEDAVTFVDRFMLRPARRSLGREDFPQYEIRSVYEAIVNAVAHRDYSLAGSKIRLFLFADRLELYSPGSLPNTLTIETMPYRVFTRNQLLVSFLSRLKSARSGRVFLESRGEGVRFILSVGEQHSGRRPVYELFGEELRLTIWAQPSPHAEAAGAAD
jgi:predicted HTH transcriptional regulator